jgi:hypothetical protein
MLWKCLPIKKQYKIFGLFEKNPKILFEYHPAADKGRHGFTEGLGAHKR